MLKYLLKLWVADKSSPMKSRVVKKGRIFTANPKKMRAQVNVFEECDSMAETHQYVDSTFSNFTTPLGREISNHQLGSKTKKFHRLECLFPDKEAK